MYPEKQLSTLEDGSGAAGAGAGAGVESFLSEVLGEPTGQDEEDWEENVRYEQSGWDPVSVTSEFLNVTGSQLIDGHGDGEESD